MIQAENMKTYDMKAKSMKGNDLMLNRLHANRNNRMKSLVKAPNLAVNQKGLVLFIALIALVVMSLAAAALIRSVDSSVLVAGNLAFKQSAIMSADTGIAEAYTWINGHATILDNDATADGYYPVLDDTMVLSNISNWDSTHSNPVSPDINDHSGNDARYILQRMCRSTGAVTPSNCLVGVGESAASSKGAKGYGNYQPATGTANAAVYRVTVRVTGPKNTTSYLQAFIY